MIASDSGGTQGQRSAAPVGDASGAAGNGSRPAGGFARTAALLGGFALVSRVLGLLRDMSMAWLVGGGAAADALVAAMRLPHVLRRMLGEGSLSMTLTASLVHLERHSPAPGQAFSQAGRNRGMRLLARALAIRLGLVLALLTALGLVAAPWLTDVLAPGFYGPERHEAIHLLRICLPYTLAAGMAALGMALLHSLGGVLAACGVSRSVQHCYSAVCGCGCAGPAARRARAGCGHAVRRPCPVVCPVAGCTAAVA